MIKHKKWIRKLYRSQTDIKSRETYLSLDKILLGLERQLSFEQISSKTGIKFEIIDRIDNLVKNTIHKRLFPPVCKIGRRTVGLDWRETIGSK